MLTPHSPCHFISRALIPYIAQMKRSCVKGRPEAVDGVPRAGGWSDRTSCGDKTPLSVSVHAAVEPSRLVTYDNATVGAAVVRQLHKRARRGRPPARRGLSQYLPAILLSLAEPVAALSRRQFCSAVAAVVVVTSNKVSESYQYGIGRYFSASNRIGSYRLLGVSSVLYS